MKCIKCGIPFSASDILVFEEGEIPICDLCAFNGNVYLINYNGDEIVVQADETFEAIQRWKFFTERKQSVKAGCFNPDQFSIRKIENVYLKGLE